MIDLNYLLRMILLSSPFCYILLRYLWTQTDTLWDLATLNRKYRRVWMIRSTLIWTNLLRIVYLCWRGSLEKGSMLFWEAPKRMSRQNNGRCKFCTRGTQVFQFCTQRRDDSQLTPSLRCHSVTWSSRSVLCPSWFSLEKTS